jgi:hypothetical protein
MAKAKKQVAESGGLVTNYVLKNRKALEDNNYIRKAPPRNYFVGFEESLVQGYVERFGEQFNLVIVGDAHEEADFYVIPYGIIRPLLTEETITIQAKGRRRWLLWIQHNGFDEGFITLDDSLRVVVTPHTESLSKARAGIVKSIAGKRAACPIKTKIKPEYLAYHREDIFRK